MQGVKDKKRMATQAIKLIFSPGRKVVPVQLKEGQVSASLIRRHLEPGDQLLEVLSSDGKALPPMDAGNILLELVGLFVVSSDNIHIDLVRIREGLRVARKMLCLDMYRELMKVDETLPEPLGIRTDLPPKKWTPNYEATDTFSNSSGERYPIDECLLSRL